MFSSSSLIVLGVGVLLAFVVLMIGAISGTSAGAIVAIVIIGVTGALFLILNQSSINACNRPTASSPISLACNSTHHVKHQLVGAPLNGST